MTLRKQKERTNQGKIKKEDQRCTNKDSDREKYSMT